MRIRYKVGDVVQAITGAEFRQHCPVGTKLIVTVVSAGISIYGVHVYDQRHPSLHNFSWSTSGEDEWFKFIGPADPEEPSCL